LGHFTRQMLNIFGKISLRAYDGKYVSVGTNDGNVVRTGQADFFDAREAFSFIENEDGTCSFKADNGCFLGTRIDGDQRVFASSETITPRERFKIICMDGNTVSLQCCENGKMLRPEPRSRGDLMAVSDYVGEMERFRWKPVDNDAVLLKKISEIEPIIRRETDNLVDRLADEVLRRVEKRLESRTQNS
jgi:hypothetical protein